MRRVNNRELSKFMFNRRKVANRGELTWKTIAEDSKCLFLSGIECHMMNRVGKLRT